MYNVSPYFTLFIYIDYMDYTLHPINWNKKLSTSKLT